MYDGKWIENVERGEGRRALSVTSLQKQDRESKVG